MRQKALPWAAMVLIATLSVPIVVFSLSPQEVAAEHCPAGMEHLTICNHGTTTTTTPSGPPGSDPPASGPPGAPPPQNCSNPNWGWQTASAEEQASWESRNGPAPDESVLQVRYCSEIYVWDGDPSGGTLCPGPGLGCEPTPVPEFRLVGPSGEPAPAPPSPAEVATAAWFACAEVWLQEPEVVTFPPADRPAIIDVPTFVAIDEWPPIAFEGEDPYCEGVVQERRIDAAGRVTVDACDAGICVAITATPALTFDPGEPGADTITCEPGGTRFDSANGPPRAQAAAPDACAHAYTQRTGAGSRPDVWPGEVSVTWAAGWTSGGASGDLPTAPFTVDLPREVIELQGIVVDAIGGGRR